MKETIYTIPITEAFEKKDGCALCRLYRDMEAREIELITGASMMEPDVRIKTNEQGFCPSHLDAMLGLNARLPLALMLQSHLEDIINELDARDLVKPKPAGDAGARLARRMDDCYVCARVDGFFDKLMSNLFTVYGREPTFRELFAAQPHFCIPHFARMLQMAGQELDKNAAQAFCAALCDIERPYLAGLLNDVSYFTKKFDYRYRDEPWLNSKDAVERAVAALTARVYDKP